MPWQYKYSGIIIIIALSLFPLLLWYPTASFSSPKIILLSLGQAAALVGTVLFSLNFILSARLKFLEPLFFGLNRIYIIHHLTGQIAFILLLFHPVLLSFWYLPIRSFSFGPHFAEWLGVLALTLLTLLLILTLFVRLPYHIWKLSHQFLGLPLFLASLHIFFIPSTVSYQRPLRYYMLSMCLAGLLAYSYRVLFGRYLVRRLTYRVASTRRLNPQVLEIILSPTQRPLKYLPGQFIFISITSPHVSRESHPFSLTSAPGSPNISLAVKASGDYTATLPRLAKGASVYLEGPFGRFCHSLIDNRRQVWVAGGIGLTPFLSMARSLTPPHPYTIDLVYTVSTPTEAVHLKELRSIARQTPRIRFFTHFSSAQGHLTAQNISTLVPDFKAADILLCGPPPMMQSLRSQLVAQGIRNSHIHSEEFSLK